ncbi:MAG: biopolymer transporter ExbD [Treponema sp. CETP13]|nr:MAG: biopolymer transporter ExbD [Treponema sp. CETP13]
MKLRRAKKPKAIVDLIPMIDVVFQLILFFLVSTTFSLMPGITLNLPVSETAESTVTQGITITASAEGDIWFNDTQVTMDELSVALDTYEENGEPITAEEKLEFPVSLEADSLVTNGTIVKIFDVLRMNGFSAVNLRTTKNDK